jgi:hypothetical protein
MRKVARVAAIAVGLACLVAFFFVHYTSVDRPGEERLEVTVGLPSPWAEYEQHEVRTETQDGNTHTMSMDFGSSYSVFFPRWSYLFGLAGVALLFAAAKRKPGAR